MFEPFDWNKFYDDVDDMIRLERRNLGICSDYRKIAEMLYRDYSATPQRPISKCKQRLISMVLDTASKHTDLIYDYELEALAFLSLWFLKHNGYFPREWMPLIDYLEK